MLLYAWLAVVIAIRAAANGLQAVREIAMGAPVVGMAITELTVLHVLGLAFLLPFLASMVSLGGTGLNPSRLALHGVRVRAYGLAELAALAARPLTWAMFLFLLPAAIPLVAAGRPAGSLISLSITFLAMIVLAEAAGRGLVQGRFTRVLAGPLRYMVAAVLLVLVAANFDFRWDHGSIRLLVFGRSVSLVDPQTGGLLARMRPWSPSAWIFQGQWLPSVGAAAVSLAAFAASMRAGRGTWSVPVFLARRGPRRRRRAIADRPRDPRAWLLRKELRALAVRPGTVISIAASLGFSAWLCAGPRSATLAFLGSFIVYLGAFGWPSNLFGLDGPAIRRYALAGIRWGEVLGTKGATWVLVTSACLVPLVACTAVRISSRLALSIAAASAVMIGLALCWGTVSSLLYPCAGPGARPAFVNQLAPFLAAAVVLAIHASGLPAGTAAFDTAMVALAAAAAALYAVLLRRAGRTLDAEVEHVLERMSAR